MPLVFFLSGLETCFQGAEAVAPKCSVKEVFLEILQNSKENTCARVSFLMKLQASAFSYRTRHVAASQGIYKGIRDMKGVQKITYQEIYLLLLHSLDFF